MSTSSIEWTDVTWNPVRGCSRVSEGCRNCYAERIAGRFSGPGQRFEGFARRGSYTHGVERGTHGGVWTGRVELVPSKLDEPLRWRSPRRVFVNSMSDLFHEALPDEAIDKVFARMALCDGTRSSGRHHTFQILTKRPRRMLAYFADPDVSYRVAAEVTCRVITGWRPSKGGLDWMPEKVWPLPNVWLGVSIEAQATADERIPLLLKTPAAVRFVSYEPALGPVDFTNLRHDGGWLQALGPRGGRNKAFDLPLLDWLIVGGESGPRARPFDVAWARSAVRQCRESGVACFVKQLGSRPTSDHRARPDGEESHWTALLRDRKGGDPAEWPEDLRVREFPTRMGGPRGL